MCTAQSIWFRKCVRSLLLKHLGHNIDFLYQKFDNGVNEVGLKFIWLWLVFKIFYKTFCYLDKISHPADLKIYYFNLELAIELFWWHVKCLLRNVLLKKASYGTYRSINEFPRILETAGGIVFKLGVSPYYLTTDWFSAIIFHGQNSLITTLRSCPCS